MCGPHADPHTEERQHATHHFEVLRVDITRREFQPHEPKVFLTPPRRYAVTPHPAPILQADSVTRTHIRTRHAGGAPSSRAFGGLRAGGCDFGRCGLGGAYTAARGNGAQTSARPLFRVNVAVFLWRPLRRKRHPAPILQLPNKLKTVHEDAHQTRLPASHHSPSPPPLQCRRAPSRSAPSRKALLTHSAPHAQRSFTHASRLAPCPLVLLTRALEP